MNVCKACNSDSVEVFNDTETLTYNGKSLLVEIQYSVCNECGREFISTEQIKHNDLAIRDAKKISDGLLSSHEILQARKALNITQEQASVIFGGGKNAFSKYERCEVSQSASMDKLIRMSLKHREVFLDLCHEAGITIWTSSANKSSRKIFGFEIALMPEVYKPSAANQESFTHNKVYSSIALSS